MSIYITKEKKEELEARIAQFDKDKQEWSDYAIKNIGNADFNNATCSTMIAQLDQAAFLLRELLSKAIIVPVEESWESLENSYGSIPDSLLKREYPNGVIIKPKRIMKTLEQEAEEYANKNTTKSLQLAYIEGAVNSNYVQIEKIKAQIEVLKDVYSKLFTDDKKFWLSQQDEFDIKLILLQQQLKKLEQ